MHSGRTSLIPSFLISLSLHFLFLVSWPSQPLEHKLEERIPVTLVPEPQSKEAEPVRKTREMATRPSRAPAEVARKSTPLPEQAEIAKDRPALLTREKPQEETHPQAPDKSPIVRRPLPTMKDLLPPVTWAPPREPRAAKDGAVRLDTREPRYISYFASIKRAIELQWEYPEAALRHGIEGKLMLELTILADGTLEGAHLLRSSGFSVLDQEAMRAVQAAAPFHPIPPWIGRGRLDIIASFEYHDNRVKYGTAP